MTFLSRQEIINKGLMFLMCTFFLFPSLVFAGDTDFDSDNIGHDVARIKTMVNRPHVKEVSIIHEIDAMTIATYSKYDKILKIWNKGTRKLLSEYNLPGNNKNDIVNEIFSIKKTLFAKSNSTLYRIDLVQNRMDVIKTGMRGTSNAVFNSENIVFLATWGRSNGGLFLYNNIEDNIKKVITLNCYGVGCELGSVNYSNKKYYIQLSGNSGFYLTNISRDYKRLRNDRGIAVFDENLNYLKIISDDEFNRLNIEKYNGASTENNTRSAKETYKYIVTDETKPELRSKINQQYKEIIEHLKTKEDNWKLSRKPLQRPMVGIIEFFLHNAKTKESIRIYDEELWTANWGGTDVVEDFICADKKVVVLKTLLIGGGGGTGFVVIDFSGTTIFEIERSANNLLLIPIGNYLFLIKNNGTIEAYDLILQNKKNFTGSAEIIKIDVSENLLIAKSADFTIKTWDLKTGKLLATKYILNEDTEVTVTPEGYFFGKGNYQDYIHFVDNKFNVYSFNQFARRFYRPEIVQLALSGKTPSDVESIESVIAKQKAPSIKIISPDNNSITSNDTALIKVDVQDNGGGVGDVYLYVNDVLVSTDTKAIKIVPKSESQFLSFNISLSEGNNRIRVIAYNKTNTMSSNPDDIAIMSNYKFDAPSLYVIAVGIDTYENNELNLKYAVADLELFAKTIAKLSEPLFKNVKIISLGKPQDTTKKAISRAFDRLALDVKAGDYFIFYNSSHGYIASFSNGDSKFFLITSNVIFLDPENLKKCAISQDELVTLIGNIPAQNKIMVLDTCHSGEAGRIIQIAMAGVRKTYTRALSAATAMQLLRIASGSSVFTASQSVEAAIEGYKGHGLFTYTLVEGMKGMADDNNDKFITLGELKGYVERGVFSRSKKHFNTKQVPYINIGTIDLSIAQIR